MNAATEDGDALGSVFPDALMHFVTLGSQRRA
jgi:hypothetical protein